MSTMNRERRARGTDYVDQAPVPKEKRRRGRPSDFEPEMVAEACDLIRQGATDREVCEELGVHVTTFWRWREQYPDFRKAVELAKDAQDDRVEASMMRVAHEGNVTAQIFWLKNRRPAKWRDRHETELVVPVSDNQNEPDVRALALQGLALLTGAVYDPGSAGGSLIDATREETADGSETGPSGTTGDAEAGASYDRDFDLDPGEQ